MTGKVGFRPSLDLSYIKFIAQMFFYFLIIWFAETLSDVLITVTSTAATKTTPRSQSSSKLSAQVPCSSARSSERSRVSKWVYPWCSRSVSGRYWLRYGRWYEKSVRKVCWKVLSGIKSANAMSQSALSPASDVVSVWECSSNPVQARIKEASKSARCWCMSLSL